MLEESSAMASSPVGRRIRACLLFLRIRGPLLKSICKWALVGGIFELWIHRQPRSDNNLNNLLAGLRRGATEARLPSSLTSDPVSSLVPPGRCQFGDEFAPATLLRRWRVSPTSVALRFGLPNSSQPLNLSTCACVLARASVREGDGDGVVVRPYTPISTNAQVGSFDLLVKDYGEDGDGGPRMSHYLGTTLKEGDATVAFSHIDKNVKIQAPFKPYHTIGMIAGGTGITPMIQAAHAILGDPAAGQKVVLLYASKRSDDILGRGLLDSWAKRHPDRLTVVHVLSQEDEGPGGGGGGDGGSVVVRGRRHIDEAMIARYFPPPEDGQMIFVCGPPSMYETFAGPRTDDELGGLLKEMGYKREQVYKF